MHAAGHQERSLFCPLISPYPFKPSLHFHYSIQERAFLACTLRDTKSVIGKLERLLGAILHVLFGFFYLYIFGVSCTGISVG